MGQSISTSIKKIVKDAMTSVDSISVQEAKSLVDNHRYQFVDVRERSEQQKVGVIPGAPGMTPTFCCSDRSLTSTN